MPAFVAGDNGAPGTVFKAIVPADADLPLYNDGFVRKLFVGGAGNLVIMGWDGTIVTLAVLAGQELNVAPKQIRAATTATLIVAYY
jgi:hypothetical protein